MIRRTTATRLGQAALAAAAAGALAAGPSAAVAAPAPSAIEVQVAPGQLGQAVDALGRRAMRVQRRRGLRLQVEATPRQAAELARAPGIAAAGPASASFADEVLSQGLDRTGAAPLARLGAGGEGLLIAVLDRGFGRNLERFQALGELPSNAQLETRSFDLVNGLAGRNAYGSPTNHGELVAQTVYDYAPRARYLFANYDTRLDFLAAVDWLRARRPDIVVHSNSFIEGPFDGTGPEARAVNQAAAEGVLWFNSAGNYARLHWRGPWVDASDDGDQDWPGDNGLTVYRGAGAPLTYALTWISPAGGPPSDVDLVIERLGADNVWQEVAAARDRQSEGAATTEQIVGYRPAAEGFFRLRARLVSGPPPAGAMTLFSREIPLSLIGGGTESSQPSPGDAEGAVSVGAVDWRGDLIKSYSAHGPTEDGRAKPDLVAPTNTSVAGLSGARRVGGTSNAAPNAAGAAALLMAAIRRQGHATSVPQMRALLASLALDLGDPGPDQVFGAGRVRVEVSSPRVGRVRPRPLASVRGRVPVEFTGVGRNKLVRWSLAVDGSPVGGRRSPKATKAGLDTRGLEDGWHLLQVEARDWAGNESRREWAIRVDNRAPRLRLRAVVVRGSRGARRRVTVARVQALDAGSTGRLRARLVATRRDGVRRVRRAALPAGRLRGVPLGRLGRGRYGLEVTVRDRAGNETTARRSFLVR